MPDADVQVIRADDPDRPLPIRLSDLLDDANDPIHRSPNGDWINVAVARIDPFRQQLRADGYLAPEGERIWFSPFALSNLDTTNLAIPGTHETRLTFLNLASTIQCATWIHYPHLRIRTRDSDGPALQQRPSFTIIVRSENVTGKFNESSCLGFLKSSYTINANIFMFRWCVAPGSFSEPSNFFACSCICSVRNYRFSC